jgi:hypothetical protein
LRREHTFIRGQILIRIELRGNPISLTTLGWSSAQDASATTNRHALSQRDLGWHGKRKLNDRALGQRSLCVEKDAATTQVLGEGRHGPAFEVNRQRKVHFETLSASAFQTTWVGAGHLSFLQHPCFVQVLKESVTINSIANLSPREVASQ